MLVIKTKAIRTKLFENGNKLSRVVELTFNYEHDKELGMMLELVQGNTTPANRAYIWLESFHTGCKEGYTITNGCVNSWDALFVPADEMQRINRLVKAYQKQNTWLKRFWRRLKAIKAYRKLHKEKGWYARMGRDQDKGIENYD